MIRHVKMEGLDIKYPSLKILFEKIANRVTQEGRYSHRLPAKRASTIIHRYNKDFKEIARSNLSGPFKQRLLATLKRDYKKVVFADTQKLTHEEKRWLYHYIVTKWRVWKQGVVPEEASDD